MARPDCPCCPNARSMVLDTTERPTDDVEIERWRCTSCNTRVAKRWARRGTKTEAILGAQQVLKRFNPEDYLQTPSGLVIPKSSVTKR